MDWCENSSTNNESGRVGEVVVIKSSQKVKVDFVIVENVGVQSHQPNKINEIP